MTGEGTMHYAGSGNTYTGDWLDDRINGKGESYPVLIPMNRVAI